MRIFRSAAELPPCFRSSILFNTLEIVFRSDADNKDDEEEEEDEEVVGVDSKGVLIDGLSTASRKPSLF